MPPGFGLLDALLAAVPVLLGLLGLLRGAPVELASCCSCMAGIAAAWAIGCLAPVQALGQPAAPLLALAAGVVAWRLMGALSHRFGFDTRWIELGRIVDSAVGGAIGALRGLAIVSVGCLAYAAVLVPFGFANPVQTSAYPVFLALGSRATSAALAGTQPVLLVNAAASGTIADVPLPSVTPSTGPAPAAIAGPSAPGNGAGLAALVQTIAPPAAAAPVHPLPAYHPDIPVRGIPAGLIETHHNILHPFGSAGRRHRH